MTAIWKPIHPTLELYEYQGIPSNREVIKSCQPILLLHSTLASHRSWDVMADQLWRSGITPLYALDMPEIQLGMPVSATFEHLTQAIQYLLEQRYPNAEALVLIGHGAGGVVGYRYWQMFEDEARLSYLILLATPHDSTVFSALREQSVRSNVGGDASLRTTASPPVDFSKIRALQGQTSTVLINIMGNQVGPDFDAAIRGDLETEVGAIAQSSGPTFDGLVRGLHLPEAVNLVVPLPPPLDHKDMNKDERIVDAILTYLQGSYYQVKLKLVGIRLHSENDVNGLSGPVAFEINGNSMPPDSVFQGVTDRLYLFEEHVPPICTLSYPLEDISCTLTLHLKDLSDIYGRRRRMYVRLHIPLRETDSSTHTMQDSDGSDFLWRIVCQRMPVALKDPSVPEKHRQLSRGI